jgi:hypothetical protein
MELGNLLEILKNFYIPANWGYFMEGGKNLLDLSVGVYAKCDV